MNLHKSSLAALAMVCVLLVHMILMSFPATAGAILAAVSTKVAYKIFYFSFWRVFKMLIIILMGIAIYVNRKHLPRATKTTKLLSMVVAIAYLAPIVMCIVRPSVMANVAYCYCHEYYHFFLAAITGVWLALWARESKETYASECMGTLAVVTVTVATLVLIFGADSYVSVIHTGAAVRWHTGALISWLVPVAPFVCMAAYLWQNRK